jgi:hypothetical protein
MEAAPEVATPPITTTSPTINMERFKSRRGAQGAGVTTLPTALPHFPLKEAADFVRLHPNEEEFWTDELCFVLIPIAGMKRDLLHLIDEDLVPVTASAAGSIILDKMTPVTSDGVFPAGLGNNF